MKINYSESKSGNLKEALRGIVKPQLIIMMSNADQFDKNVAELEDLMPGVPSIGCIAMSYCKDVLEKGVSITAFTEGVTAVTNVLEEVSKTPVKYIERFENDAASVKPGSSNTAVIDLCSGNDAVVLSTIQSVLNRYHMELMGGTGDAGRVSCNGKVYTDAMAYAIIKNNNGRVKAYKENIYTPRQGVRLIASRTDKSKYYIGELNGQPAKRVYMDLTGVSESGISDQTFKNPLGKMIGDDICIISLKGVEGNGLCCYRQVNDSDILTLLEARDISEIVSDTISHIRSDFNRVSAVFSVNCAFRYIVMQNQGIVSDYLGQMGSLGTHCGFIGYGEHYNGQFINQTMTCVVFE
ncbi:MAG: hypothetical protein J6O70_03615 [Lachnospiraceae bacterium]|nr:hypothetical protein [Lachnospiraceae bacterium]